MLRALVLPLVCASAAVSGALIPAALAGAPATAPSPEAMKPPSSDEILVTASRMRLVDLTYSLRDRRLSTCTITKSSGVRDVDVAVCDILNACIRQGRTTPSGAKSCLNDTIKAYRRNTLDLSQLTGRYARNYDIQFGEDGDDAPMLQALAKRGGKSARAALQEPPEPQTPAMVVTGNRNPITAGQWQFEQTGYMLTDTGTRTLGRVWFVCIRDGALHYTIDDMIQRSFYSPDVPSWCVRWNVTLGGDNTITGNQRCWVTKGLRLRGALKGRIQPEEVHLKRDMYLQNVQPSNDDILYPETHVLVDPEAHMNIDGRRIGDCNPDKARPGDTDTPPS